MALMRFFASAAHGTEEALFRELRRLRFASLQGSPGGVRFRGESILEGARACLQSRVAMRVMLHVADVRAHDAQQLYDGVRAQDWSRWLNAKTTLAVRVTGTNRNLVHTGFTGQKAKDAIVDRLRDELGARPSVDRDDPDVRVAVHVAGGQASLFLDLSGAPLHQRGYRADGGTAPLKETLAAAMLLLSGWDGTTELVDPMCGSGTIAIEADLLARNVAPGLLRTRFGFERWASFGPSERKELAALREQLRADVRAEGPAIYGSDIDSATVERAIGNAKLAGARVSFRQSDALHLRLPIDPGHPGQSAYIVSNPPFGERLALPMDALHALVAQRTQHTVALLAGHEALEEELGQADARFELRNGNLPCALLLYRATKQATEALEAAGPTAATSTVEKR